MTARLTLLTLLLVSPATVAEDDSKASTSNVSGLLSNSNTRRKESQEQVIQSRNTTIVELIAIIDDKKNRKDRPDAVYRAMRLLGELRASEGAEILAEHIGFPYLVDFGEPLRVAGPSTLKGQPQDLFPAVRSLIQIGTPSIDVVLEKIAETEDMVKLNAYIAVLRAVERKITIRDQLDRVIEKAPPRRQKVLRIVRSWLDDPPASILP